MTIIKNWQPTQNSQQWENVVSESEGPDTPMESGRLFFLWRELTEKELQPLADMEEAITCECTYSRLVLIVDAPLVRIVHQYLNTLE